MYKVPYTKQIQTFAAQISILKQRGMTFMVLSDFHKIGRMSHCGRFQILRHFFEISWLLFLFLCPLFETTCLLLREKWHEFSLVHPQIAGKAFKHWEKFQKQSPEAPP
jgi:hypothetical protein